MEGEFNWHAAIIPPPKKVINYCGMFNVRNRLASLLIRICGFVVLATLMGFYISWIRDLFWIARFEVQVGILYLGTLFFEIIFNAISLRYGVLGYPGGVYMPYKLSITMYVGIATVLHLTVPFSTLAGEKTLIAGLYSGFLLVFSLIDWIFFDEKGTVKYTTALTYMIYPVFYFIFSIFTPFMFGKLPMYWDGTYVPYGYLNYENDTEILFVVIAIFILFVVGIATIFLNNVLSGKYKKRQAD